MNKRAIIDFRQNWFLVIIFVILVGFIGALWFGFIRNPNLTPIIEEQQDIKDEIYNLRLEIEGVRQEIDKIKANTENIKDSALTAEDIEKLDKRLDSLYSKLNVLEEEISNIEPKVVQKIDIFSPRTWIYNYNVRIAITFLLALTLFEITIHPLIVYIKKRYNSFKEENKEEYYEGNRRDS